VPRARILRPGNSSSRFPGPRRGRLDGTRTGDHAPDPLEAAVLPLAACAALLLSPAPGWAWGSATHHYIAQNYSKHLPAFIDGLRAWDSVVDAHVTDPDTRRPSTPGEAPRHFIDIDSYSEFLGRRHAA
jgi:hypothetical protein